MHIEIFTIFTYVGYVHISSKTKLYICIIVLYFMWKDIFLSNYSNFETLIIICTTTRK